MNKTVAETRKYLEEFLKLIREYDDREVLICPPFTSLQTAGNLLRDTPVKLGAQNCHYEGEGAFTGEVSARMLTELGCEYVIIGHSERRHIFGEDDEVINKKLIRCLEEGLRPILCVGEKLEDREAGMTNKVVETQIRLALSRIEKLTDRLDIAYEPVWAIGTGVPASPSDAQEVHHFIRELLKELNPGAESKTRILYGGSVKPQDAGDFMREDDIDGLLVGGASLDPESFFKIVEAF
jgi:triosephosphate isomerase